MVFYLYAGILVGYVTKNQCLGWDGRSVRVRHNIIFNKNNLPFYKKI